MRLILARPFHVYNLLAFPVLLYPPVRAQALAAATSREGRERDAAAKASAALASATAKLGEATAAAHREEAQLRTLRLDYDSLRRRYLSTVASFKIGTS